MGTFITNSGEKSLKERLQTLIGNSEELKFLVGFFYFSGIRELYETLKTLYESEALKEEHLKILVGLNIDKSAYGIYESARRQRVYSGNKLKKDFYRSLKTAFNSEELDRKETYEQIEFFIQLLKEGKLVLRKTREPNHAKLYLFKMNESFKQVIPALFITGSSNLTKAGLESQDEFNVEIMDFGFREAEKYFDRLWNRAIAFSKEDIDKIISILTKNSLIREITPFTAYAYLLKTYLELHKGKDLGEELKRLMKTKGYIPYTYQLEAVSQALANCEAHGGTLIADVVGLGKTVIACLVAKALGKRGIVICPPHLIGDENRTSGWKKYLSDFKLYDWEVRSVGKLESTLEFVRESEDIEIIIVDEAHRFRNERTQSYHYLNEICRGKIVLLLTATPFNNRPSDLYALLKLFTVPRKSTIVLDENLEERFSRYEAEFRKLSYIRNYHNSLVEKRRNRAIRYYRDVFGESSINMSKVKGRTRGLAREIRAILEPVVIRRNRLDLRHYKEKIDLPEVKDPSEWFFELTEEQLEFYDEVIKSFSQLEDGGRFKGAIYFPIRYEKGVFDYLGDSEEPELNEEESFIYLYQKNLYDFMRRLLVKRFESSFGAFKESVERFIKIHRSALTFIKKTNKFILDRRLMDEIVSEDPEVINERLERYEKDLREEKLDPRYYKVYDIRKFKGEEQFKRDIKSDLKLFESLLNTIEKIGLVQNDPKAERLVEGIREFLKEDRKVVIFTEYFDTATHLKDILSREFEGMVLPAFGSLSKKTVEDIYKNFDAQYKHQEDSYKILLATDKLSEGFNLNRAGVVVNYDIPWNPVRVIQRVGRINRIGKKLYDEIFIVNFFPTEKGADIVKSREIAQTKMFMIHNVLGEDAKIFTPDEEPQPAELYRRLTTYTEEEEESFFTKLKREYEKIKERFPEIEEEIKDMPVRVKVAKRGEENELLVFVKKGKDLFVGYKNYSEKQPVSVGFEQAYEKIKTSYDEPGLPLSDNFWTNYHEVLRKESYFRRKSRGRDLSTQAYNILNGLLERDDKDITPYKSFISDLLEDVRSFGTLSDYVLSRIAGWGKKNTQELKEELEALKNEIGENFLKKIGEYLKEINEEVIIAVENQVSRG